MFPVTITIHNAQQLAAVFAVLGGPSDAGDKYPAAPAAHKINKAVQEKIQADYSTPEKGAEPIESYPKAEEKPKAKGKAAALAVDYKTAAEKVMELSLAKGREAAIDLLRKFGAERLPDIPPERYSEVMVACQDAMV